MLRYLLISKLYTTHSIPLVCRADLAACVAIMCWLQGQGRVGLAVQWGNWGGGGMAVRNKGFIERMERMGLGIGEGDCRP